MITLSTDNIFYIIDFGLIILIAVLIYYFFRKRRKIKIPVQNKNILWQKEEPIKAELQSKIPESIPNSQSSSDINNSVVVSSDLNLDKLNKELKDRDDERYERALKVTAQEITHAHDVGKKQLDLQVERERRSRLIT